MNRKVNRHISLLLTAITMTYAGAAVAQTVNESLVLLSQLDRSNVPVWTDAQILTQFKFIRDERYLYERGDTTTPKRRISWLDPSGGCDTRADLACYLMLSDANTAKSPYVKTNPPWKIRAVYSDGDMGLETPYDNGGNVSWGSHVAPVVKNPQGDLIVLDPAFNHCTPLKLEEWLAMMVPDFNVFNDPDDYYRVALSDHKALQYSDLAFNEPTASTHFAESRNLAQSENGYLQNERTNLLSLAWTTPEKVSQMLGDLPPWAGNSCISISRGSPTSLQPNYGVHQTIQCASGTLAVGGGFLSSSDRMPVVGTGKLDDGAEGWWADVRENTSSENQRLSVSAMCLSGAPTNATVTKITGPTQTVSPWTTTVTTATCTSGLLVGGGYWTHSAVYSTSPIAKVFRSMKSTSQNKTWEVAAYNPGNEGKLITAFAVCLNNTNFTVEQTSGTLAADGQAKASCPGSLHTMGGGFEFPWYKNYTVLGMNNVGTGQYTVTMSPAPPSGDVEAKSFAMCLRSEPDPAPPCTVSTAVDMGAPSSKVTTVAGNGCLKISYALPSWARTISLQSQSSGVNYPIPYTWTNCSNTGSQTITGNWVTNTLSPISSTCTTLIRLTGSAASSVSLKWWPNG